MKGKNNKKSTDAMDELEIGFLLDEIDNLSEEELDKIIQESGGDITQAKNIGLRTFREIQEEFEEDWRQVSIEDIENASYDVSDIPLRTKLSKKELINRINTRLTKLSSQQAFTKLSAGVAHRNLKNDSVEDLASLLRQIEAAVRSAGISVDD